MSAWSLMRVMAVGLGELGSVVAVENWPLRALSEEPSPALLMLQCGEVASIGGSPRL